MRLLQDALKKCVSLKHAKIQHVSYLSRVKLASGSILNLIHINQRYCATNIHHNISWSLLFPGSLKRYILLTLDCGRCSRVGSGAFGVSSVSAFSVTTRVGGGTGTLSRAGTQGREGGWHTLVVIHPNQVEKCSFDSASLEIFSEDFKTKL